MPNNKIICLTGNHHTPAIELIRQFNQSGTVWQIHYLTHHYQTETHIKNTLAPQLQTNLRLIQCNKFDRQKPLLSLLKSPLLLLGIIQSFFILKEIRPNIIVSFGGYVSVPVIIAGWLLKIPSITHEQTTTISLATRINSFFCQKIALSFPSSEFYSKKVVMTGNLLRQQIFNHHSEKYHQLESRIKQFPLIYVTGGNQGSQFINELIMALLPHLTKYTIIHQTGQKPISQNESISYHPTEYISSEDIGWIFYHASLIISRAGANICQEIKALNQKAIIIPHPKTQQDEQIKNAQWLKSKLPHQITVIPQNLAIPEKMLLAIKDLISQPSKKPTKLPTLTHPLVKLINDLA